MNECIKQVNNQLLASDMRDSTIPNTGLPLHFKNMGHGRVPGPVLVQIMSLTEIGHSAFSLQNIWQTRIERADLAGLGCDSGAVGETDDSGPIPKYPRSMLKLELTDGSMSIHAVEYRRLAEVRLEDTPLGCKVRDDTIIGRSAE